MLKISRPLLYALIATVGVAAYLMTAPTPPKKHSATRKLTAPRTVRSQYEPEDYEAHFSDAVLVSRDGFKPLVERRSNALAVALAAAGGIPAEFAGGDPNWVCTGSAEVDGVRQALLENKSTNDAVFVKQGDHWKNCVVTQVLEEAVVLVGPDGEAKTIQVQQDTTQQQESESTDTLPLKPQLSGPIGTGQPAQVGNQVPMLPAPDTNSQTENDNAG